MGKSGNPAVAAEQAEPITYDPTPVDEDGVEDFDAYWSSVERTGPRVRVAGVVIDLPPAIPLEFDLLAKRMAKSNSEVHIKRLLAILFGGATLEQWAEAGMDLEQFKVLLAWAPQRIAGSDVSVAEVAAKVKAAEDAQESGEA